MTMLFLSRILLILMLMKQCLSDDHWDYSALGPDVWSERFSACSGKRQSPINIKTACTIYKSFDPLIFTAEHVEEKSFIIKNNGHTMSVTPVNTQFAIQGADLNGTFYFDSFHLHWGPNHNTGSEHQINGIKAAGESHFVYKNSLTNESTVLSFLMQSRMKKNVPLNDQKNLHQIRSEAEWKKYFDISQKLPKEGDSMPIDLTLNLLMGNQLNEYWRYLGSLTTPPCTENVIWNVFKEPTLILDYEFESFRHDLFYESFRGPQPLYYRDVYRTFLTETTSTIPDQNCCIQTKSQGESVIFNKNISLLGIFVLLTFVVSI